MRMKRDGWFLFFPPRLRAVASIVVVSILIVPLILWQMLGNAGVAFYDELRDEFKDAARRIRHVYVFLFDIALHGEDDS